MLKKLQITMDVAGNFNQDIIEDWLKEALKTYGLSINITENVELPMHNVTQEEFEQITEGTTFYVMNNNNPIQAESDAFYNNDAELKGWEVEGTDGNNYSIDGVVAIFGN